MRLHAHGIQVTLPNGWSGRVFARDLTAATLHAGNFTLAVDDGEFGDRSTAAMRQGATFLALTEYMPGSGLEPGRGLFSARRIPLPLDPTAFAGTGLAHPRPGQAGMQRFFTAAGRPFCLYVVISVERTGRTRQLAAVDRVLRSLKVEPRPQL